MFISQINVKELKKKHIWNMIWVNMEVAYFLEAIGTAFMNNNFTYNDSKIVHKQQTLYWSLYP